MNEDKNVSRGRTAQGDTTDRIMACTGHRPESGAGLTEQGRALVRELNAHLVDGLRTHPGSHHGYRPLTAGFDLAVIAAGRATWKRK